MICGGSVELLVCGVGVWRWEGVQGCAEQIVELVQDRCMTSVCVCGGGREGGRGGGEDFNTRSFTTLERYGYNCLVH